MSLVPSGEHVSHSPLLPVAWSTLLSHWNQTSRIQNSFKAHGEASGEIWSLEFLGRGRQEWAEWPMLRSNVKRFFLWFCTCGVMGKGGYISYKLLHPTLENKKNNLPISWVFGPVLWRLNMMYDNSSPHIC